MLLGIKKRRLSKLWLGKEGPGLFPGIFIFQINYFFQGVKAFGEFKVW